MRLDGIRRLLGRVRRPRLDAELAEEIEHHIALRRQALVDAGMDPRDAAHEARRQFGNATYIREESSIMWSFPTFDALMQDLRYGMRLLRHSPVFTAVAVLSLAIGIGSALAVFSLADATLFRKLPVRNPDELVVLRWAAGPVPVVSSLSGNFDMNDQGSSSTSFSVHAFETFQREGSRYADVFAFADLFGASVAIGGRSEGSGAQVVSGNYFDALDVRPAAGRLLGPSDDRQDAPPAAVISDDVWERYLERSPSAVGQPITLNGLTFTIVGVTPRGFRGTLQVSDMPAVTIPLAWYGKVTRRDNMLDPDYWWVLMMGRLRPGVTAAQAGPALDLLLKQSVAAGRPSLAARDLPRLEVLPGSRGQVESRDGMREPLRTMTIVVGIVLLVACANVASLLLARGRARARELAVRAAIGAARSRIVRQLVTEGVLLAAIGSALGLLAARWIAAALLPAVGAATLAPLVDASPGWALGLLAVGLATVCTLAFAIVPAIRATAFGLTSELQEGGRAPSSGRQRTVLSSALVVVQVALAMVLVSAAGLLVHSVWNLRAINPGFDPEQLLIFSTAPSLNGYDRPRSIAFMERALERLSALPGVESATLMSNRLISGNTSTMMAFVPGTPVPDPALPAFREFARRHRTFRMTVGEDFLKTMRIPLLRGRDLVPADANAEAPVGVVNRALAMQVFGTEDVLGRRISIVRTPGDRGIEIVGVCADAKYNSIRNPAPPTIYLAFRQQGLGGATFAVRTAGDPLLLAGAARDVIRQLDAALPVNDMLTQVEQIGRSIARERLFARLALSLGGVTLLLSAIGLYALLAYSVARRTPEIGIRMALGAERGTVSRMVLRQSLGLVAAGLVLGVPAAYWGTGIVRSMLFELSATDPRTFAAAVIVLLGTSLAAAYIPARRAARVDPMIALRSE